jgi:hypothetical protein
MAHRLNIVRAIIAAATLVVVWASLAPPAEARGGGRGFARGFSGHGGHGPQFAGGRRHGNDASIKAASEDRDKLLTTQIKSICRGC